MSAEVFCYNCLWYKGLQDKWETIIPSSDITPKYHQCCIPQIKKVKDFLKPKHVLVGTVELDCKKQNCDNKCKNYIEDKKREE